MMNADIEALVLSGELFNGPAGSTSPPRSPSPDAGWHDDELAAAEHSDNEKGNSITQRTPNPRAHHGHSESIGMGPGRTGVKGVIKDRDEANEMQQYRRDAEMEELRARMEKGDLGGKTYLEEEREKGSNADILVQRERQTSSFHRPPPSASKGRFGHLREIGRAGFVNAVEKEEKGIWVVLHLYQSSVDRCATLDDTLAQLARVYPNTKFLRCKASALGFASSSTTSSSRITRAARPAHKHDSDDEEELSDEDANSSDDEDESRVDTDMLPTVLIYQSGQLVHNWVRVDFEVPHSQSNPLSPGPIGELLENHNIVPRAGLKNIFENAGPSDDEDDDLDWGDLEP